MKNIKETIFFILCGITFILCGISFFIVLQGKAQNEKDKRLERDLYLANLHQEDQEFIARLEEELLYQAETLDTTSIVLTQYIVETSKNKTSQEDALKIVLRSKETFKNTEIDFRWMLAILNRESQFLIDAYNPRDPAKGICQITKPCLDSYNKCHTVQYEFDDMFNLDKCLDVGLWYFKDLCHTLEYVSEAVSAYNQGVSGVRNRGVSYTNYFNLIESHYLEICSISNGFSNLLDKKFEVALK